MSLSLLVAAVVAAFGGGSSVESACDLPTEPGADFSDLSAADPPHVVIEDVQLERPCRGPPDCEVNDVNIYIGTADGSPIDPTMGIMLSVIAGDLPAEWIEGPLSDYVFLPGSDEAKVTLLVDGSQEFTAEFFVQSINRNGELGVASSSQIATSSASVTFTPCPEGETEQGCFYSVVPRRPGTGFSGGFLTCLLGLGLGSVALRRRRVVSKARAHLKNREAE